MKYQLYDPTYATRTDAFLLEEADTEEKIKELALKYYATALVKDDVFVCILNNKICPCGKKLGNKRRIFCSDKCQRKNAYWRYKKKLT